MLDRFLAYYTEEMNQCISQHQNLAFSKLVYTPNAYTVVIAVNEDEVLLMLYSGYSVSSFNR